MSTLGKIREKSTLLLIIIGGALLAFILGDLLTSNTRFFGAKGNEIGEIAGNTITYEVFEGRVMKAEENYKLNSGAGSIDDATKDQLRNQVWNQLVNEMVMEKEFEKLGITVTSLELYDLVRGEDPAPSVKQAFTDPNSGVFDPARVLQFLKSKDQDQTGATNARWVEFEEGLKKEKVAEKYNNLIKKGLYTTSVEAKQNNISRNKQAKISFVVKRYNTLSDSLVKFDDSDLKKYYNENLNKFEQEASRDVDYIAFNIEPSADDILAVEEQAQKLTQEFKESTDDSSFVKLNSDNQFNMDYKSFSQLDTLLQNNLFNADKGTVVGPYKDGAVLKIAKLVDSKSSPDSVKARHILIKFNNNDTLAAKNKADSLKTIIKKGAKFSELAEKVSEDMGSAAKGGDLGWFAEGAMVKPFSDACFNGKKGDLQTVVSQFGVHLIEVLDKSTESKKVSIAFVEVKIEPSQLTYQDIYAKASTFANENNSIDKFEKAAATNNMLKIPATNIKETDRTLVGLDNSREFVRWMYKSEKNQVSPAFEFGSKYVIGVLKEVREKGTAPFDQVKDQLTSAVIKEKKAQKFSEEMANNPSLSALATKIGSQLETAENVNFAAGTIPGAGRELFVTGALFGLKKGIVSKPLHGEAGVFVVKIDSLTEAQPLSNIKEEKKQLSSSNENRVYEVYEALKDNANVIDNRGKFY